MVTVLWKKINLKLDPVWGAQQAASSQGFLLFFFFCVFLALATKTGRKCLGQYFPAELAKKLQKPSLFLKVLQLKQEFGFLIYRTSW